MKVIKIKNKKIIKTDKLEDFLKIREKIENWIESNSKFLVDCNFYSEEEFTMGGVRVEVDENNKSKIIRIIKGILNVFGDYFKCPCPEKTIIETEMNSEETYISIKLKHADYEYEIFLEKEME